MMTQAGLFEPVLPKELTGIPLKVASILYDNRGKGAVMIMRSEP